MSLFLNKNYFKKPNGFSLIEILISLAVLTSLLLIGTLSFSDLKTDKELQAIAGSIVSKLEEAKSNSLSGKGGSSYGVKFNDDSYVYFPGSSYIVSNDGNKEYQINSNFQMSNDIPGSSDSIVFSKITGDSNYAATVTLFISSDPESKIEIIIGELGDISMIKY